MLNVPDLKQPKPDTLTAEELLDWKLIRFCQQEIAEHQISWQLFQSEGLQGPDVDTSSLDSCAYEYHLQEKL